MTHTFTKDYKPTPTHIVVSLSNKKGHTMSNKDNSKDAIYAEIITTLNEIHAKSHRVTELVTRQLFDNFQYDTNYLRQVIQQISDQTKIAESTIDTLLIKKALNDK